MFARSISIHLKPNSVAEFTRTLDEQIIPTLRKQKGFQDEIAFVAPNGTDAFAISLWDQEENAEAYQLRIYPEVLKSVAKVTDGTPQLHTYEVSNSTFHKIAGHVAA